MKHGEGVKREPQSSAIPTLPFTRNHETWAPLYDFQCWRVNFKTELCVSTSTPELTMSWITEVEMAKSIDDLMTSESTEGKHFPDFEMRDSKIASALRKIISNANFKRRVRVEEQRAQKHDRFLRGRQIAYMLCDHNQATGAYDAAQGLSHRFNICLHDDDVQDFDTGWDQVQLATSKIPQENVLEGLFKGLRTFKQYWQCTTKTRIEIGYRQAINDWTLVGQHIDQMIRTRNFKARNELRQGYWPRVTQGEKSPLRGKWENAISEKQLDSVQKDTLAVSATDPIMVKKHNRPLLLQRRRHRLT